MAKHFAFSTLGGLVGVLAADSNTVDLGALPAILALLIGGSGIGALLLVRVQRRKLTEETSDLAMQKLQRAMEAQERVYKTQLEFAEKRIATLEHDLQIATAERDAKAHELENVRRRRDELERLLHTTQERLVMVQATLADQRRRLDD